VGDAQRAAALRLVFKRRAGGLSLTGRTGPPRARELPRIDLPATAAGARDGLPLALLDFKDKGDNLSAPDEGRAADALRELQKKGTTLALKLLGGQTALDVLARFCVEALPPRADLVAEPPLVEIEAPIDVFPPLELLPLLDQRWPERMETPRDLDEAAACFVGFAAVTKRILPGSVSQDPVLRNTPLPIAFFRDLTMEGAHQEEQFFTSLGDHVDFGGSWPRDDVSTEEAADFLSRCIFYGSHAGERADQVHHFACHCFSTSESSDDWSLRLAGEEATVEVTSEDLNFAIRQRRRGAPTARPPLPLVFMNACGSAAVDPSSPISFPALFIDNGNRAFVGTETRIPDEFAAAFSRRFYESLFVGNKVGDSLHRARWALARRTAPLGILYTLYGNPELRIEPPIAREALYV
jgi:hypothetical protein